MTATLELNWDKSPDQLLPAIVQDAQTGRVLMLGYFSQESLRRTRESGRVTFFSRSRQMLWEKGATSGNFLSLVSIEIDCDGDALLVKAIPEGPICHKGMVSCFGDGEGSFQMLGELERVIHRRSVSAPADSYTARLLRAGLNLQGAKIVEEAAEVVYAAHSETPERVAEETADLFYHVLVLLRNLEVELSSIHRVLSRRRR